MPTHGLEWRVDGDGKCVCLNVPPGDAVVQSAFVSRAGCSFGGRAQHERHCLRAGWATFALGGGALRDGSLLMCLDAPLHLERCASRRIRTCCASPITSATALVAGSSGGVDAFADDLFRRHLIFWGFGRRRRHYECYSRARLCSMRSWGGSGSSRTWASAIFCLASSGSGPSGPPSARWCPRAAMFCLGHDLRAAGGCAFSSLADCRCFFCVTFVAFRAPSYAWTAAATSTAAFEAMVAAEKHRVAMREHIGVVCGARPITRMPSPLEGSPLVGADYSMCIHGCARPCAAAAWTGGGRSFNGMCRTSIEAGRALAINHFWWQAPLGIARPALQL